MRVLGTKEFCRFARKEGITDAALLDAAKRAERGLVDADLGGGLIKQRVPRRGQGRSGGYRTLMAYRMGDRIVFLYGFAKSEMDNVRPDVQVYWQQVAAHLLQMDDREMRSLIATREIMEIGGDG